MQIRFVAYQNISVTLSHQIVTTSYCISIVIFTIVSLRITNRKICDSSWRIRRELFDSPILPMAIFISSIGIAISWFAATLPEEADITKLDDDTFDYTKPRSTLSACVYDDWWVEERCLIWGTSSLQIFRRYIEIRNDTVSSENPPVEITAAYIGEKMDPDGSWDHVKYLDLSIVPFAIPD